MQSTASISTEAQSQIVILNRTTLLLSALMLAACASHEGFYEPDCVAFEGHRIKLDGGRFVWDRFTDQRVIGDDGKLVDPFPGFPKTGTYSATAGRLELLTDDGTKLDDWFYVNRGGRFYLLSGEQHEAFLESNTLPECALTVRDAGST